MSNKSYLYSDQFQILKAFHSKFPQLTTLARESKDINEFKEKLKLFLSGFTDKKGIVEKILILINYDSENIHELSTGETIHIETIYYLWRLLCGKTDNGMTTDYLLEIYNLYSLLLNTKEKTPTNLNSDRWSSGMNKEVQQIRGENKKRIISL